MPSHPLRPAIRRRRFLGLVGASTTAALTAGALSGCGSGSGGGGGGSASDAGSLDDLIPTHIPFEGVTPDIKGRHGAPDGFTAYPENFVRAMPEAPGRGGHYTAMTPLWGPIPPGLGANSFFDYVNGRLGATVEFNFQDGNTVIDKMNAVIAGRDVADITMIPDWTINLIPQFNRAVGELFEDLTPHLAGDAARAYPLLANLDSDAWRWNVFNQRLHGVPWPSEPFGNWVLYRRDLMEEYGIEPPSSPDDLFAIGEEVNDPDNNRWAFGDFNLSMRQVFGAPKQWRYEGGELVHMFETDEWRASVEYMRKVFDAGLVHPDIVAQGDNAKELLNSGQIVFNQDGIGAWHEAYMQMLGDNPDFRLDLMPVFGNGGGDPVMHRSDPSGQSVFVRKGMEPEQVEEILGILDFCAAPFGTREYMDYRYGEEGVHHELNDDGAPQLTDTGNAEVNDGYYFLSGRPPAVTESQYPDFVQWKCDWYNHAAQFTEEDPFAGIRIQRPERFSAAETPMTDRVEDIIRGREGLGALDEAVANWRRDGGDEGREFYMKVLQEHGRD
ncbi:MULTISPECIES: extracellular solute-binding protein [Nocardiopsis]|uniref:Putative aldouronate transport system substrate-binding protein n=1 Tax=Nocardiopsis sinuspersici TaxID=501010 RepID=A0A1V3C5S6_9ACTN|nr:MULTISPECIES: extracellular solute-binding protein [Nocardiopsis]NYH52337.1 putative aldouronate transport system substrate-binding protein [Nocardiopsis sinuspersici]OOC55829.1 sugar ABC transporter substrate-binding protein [Nocardiopsis sinuspersici]